MKLIRMRKPSMKTLLGVTRVKRRIARATGIPATKAGRKRKALNMLTGGQYGKYERARAAVNRPFKAVKNPASCLGCLVYVLGMAALIAFALAALL